MLVEWLLIGALAESGSSTLVETQNMVACVQILDTLSSYPSPFLIEKGYCINTLSGEVVDRYGRPIVFEKGK